MPCATSSGVTTTGNRSAIFISSSVFCTTGFGPPDATNRVKGQALDFCLLVSRRRHPDDLDVAGYGADAERWLDIAQAYRGPAGAGRAAGQFAA